jgi:hypothetical protein
MAQRTSKEVAWRNNVLKKNFEQPCFHVAIPMYFARTIRDQFSLQLSEYRSYQVFFFIYKTWYGQVSN